MKIIYSYLIILLFMGCNASSDKNTTDTNAADSSTFMNDGTVNADTIDKRTDARLDKGADTLR